MTTHKLVQTLGASGYEVARVKVERKLLDAVTTTGAGSSKARQNPLSSVLGWGTTTAGAGSATVAIEVSNDGTNWVVAGTLSLTLATTVTTTTNTDGFNINADWAYIRANVTAISGTGAAVTVSI